MDSPVLLVVKDMDSQVGQDVNDWGGGLLIHHDIGKQMLTEL